MQTWLINAYKHAEQEYPKESCGLIFIPYFTDDCKELRYWPCRNLATTDEEFVLHPEDYADCEDKGRIQQIIHSHPNYPPKPSQADLVSCEKGEIPWTIIGWPSKTHQQLVPSGYQAPLLGREFSFGILDCYTIVKDYYKWNLTIELVDYERENYFWERGENLYEDNFRKEGFSEVPFTELQKHDLILMAIKSRVINHAAIFLGYRDFNGKTKVPVILHHVQGRLSEETVYGGFWHKNVRKVIRHREMFNDNS